MSANMNNPGPKGACSCLGSPTVDDNRSLLSRLWQTIKAWEEAMDDSGQDYVFARLSVLEKEVSVLRAELENRASNSTSAGRS